MILLSQFLHIPPLYQVRACVALLTRFLATLVEYSITFNSYIYIFWNYYYNTDRSFLRIFGHGRCLGARFNKTVPYYTLQCWFVYFCPSIVGQVFSNFVASQEKKEKLLKNNNLWYIKLRFPNKIFWRYVIQVVLTLIGFLLNIRSTKKKDTKVRFEYFQSPFWT